MYVCIYTTKRQADRQIQLDKHRVTICCTIESYFSQMQEREAAERARRELELLAEQAAVEERRKKEAEEKELQKREDEKRQREEEERAVRQREEEEEKALKEETNRQRVAERNYSTAFIGEEKASKYTISENFGINFTVLCTTLFRRLGLQHLNYRSVL